MSLTEIAVPKEDRYFEDYVPGTVYEFPETVTASEADIVDFAQKYDPQYFHTDPEAAQKSIYKGLIASGAQTIALTFHLYVKNFLPGKASFGSPGFDELRWYLPLRPGDVLRIRMTVEDAKPSQSKPDRGMIFSLVETINQNNEVIMSYKAKNLMARRPA